MSKTDYAEWLIDRILEIINRPAARSSLAPRFSDEERLLVYCVGKQAYACKADVDKSISRTKRKGRLAVTPYKCPACGKWHKGTSAGKRKFDRKGNRHE